MILKYRLLYGFSLLLVFSSCIKDDFDKMQKSNWEPELAIPLIDSRINIDRLIKKFDTEGYLINDAEDVIVVVYKGRLFTIQADEVVKLDDIIIPLAQVQKLGKVPVDPGNGFLLKSIDLDQGSLKVEINDDITEDVRIVLSMPKTKKDGIIFQETFTVKYSGLPVSSFDTVFDISNYLMDLTGDGNQRNQLNINYTANEISDNDSVDLNIFNITFQNLSFLFIDGYFGNMNLGSHLDSIKINMFDNFKSGSILLEDPKFQLDIINGFGLPIHMTFGNFDGSGHGGSSQLSGSAIDDGLDLNTPSGGGAPPGQTSKTIDSSNSNIKDFLRISPSSLKFSFNLEGNSNNDTNTYNFIDKNSSLSGDISLSIPLKGSFDHVVIEDVYDFDTGELKNVNYATFKLTTNNSFPVGIYVQIYFLDKDSLVLDSLIEDNDAIFKEAIVDANGFSIAPVYEESFFSLGANRFGAIRDKAVNLKIRVMLLTSDSDKTTIKITSDNYFDIKLGLRAEMKF